MVVDGLDFTAGELGSANFLFTISLMAELNDALSK
jgi:hypothetical protein